MQRLAAELARYHGDPAARRARLRQWQRAYHPDKNPGRDAEVLPIFRWVQTQWDQCFRSATDAPDASAAPGGSTGGSGHAQQRAPAPAAQARPAAVLQAAPRRRLLGKRPAST